MSNAKPSPPLHVLHLTRGGLRWLTLRWERNWRRPLGDFAVADAGSVAGDPMALLDEWAERKLTPAAEVFLYDSRPRYFTFVTRAPSKAARQSDQIARLRVRQELGLSEEEVNWTVRADPVPNAPGLVDLFGAVARRGSFDDVMEWQKRRGVALWIGADVTAIRALFAGGALAAPAALVNAEEADAAFYKAEAGGQLVKGRIPLDPAKAESAPDGYDGEPLSIFGGEEARRALAGHPALAAAPAAAAPKFAGVGQGARLLASLAPDLAPTDAVLLGGVYDLRSRLMPPSLRPKPGALSLIRGIAQPSIPMIERAERVPWPTAAGGALGAAALLALTTLGVRSLHESWRLDLVKQANSMASKSKAYTSEEGVLRKIKADRTSVMPIFAAIHEAAPAGLTLQSVSLSENGALQVEGEAFGQGVANDFLRGVAESKLFERVQLQDVKADKEGKRFTFQLAASVKGRGKKKK